MVGPVSEQVRVSNTADDTLAGKARDASIVSGGHHLVAKALKAEGVDAVFTRCGGDIVDIGDGRARSGQPLWKMRAGQNLG